MPSDFPGSPLTPLLQILYHPFNKINSSDLRTRAGSVNLLPNAMELFNPLTIGPDYIRFLHFFISTLHTIFYTC